MNNEVNKTDSNSNNNANNAANGNGSNSKPNSNTAGNRPNKHKKPYWKHKKKKSSFKPGVGQDTNKAPHKKNWNNKNKQFKSKIHIPTHYFNELEKIAKNEKSTITDVTLQAVKQYILDKDKEKNKTQTAAPQQDNSTQKKPSLLKRLFGLK